MAEVWEVMWESLPPGFRFHPTDEEFVDHYLMNYIHGITEDICVIPTVNDLFKQDPWELPKIFASLSIIRPKDPEWWFLSTLDYKPVNSDKFDRRTSTGSWKITGNPTEIHNRAGNRLIAIKRNLVFSENHRKNEKPKWVFHEYHLQDDSLELTLREQKKYVLCHLVGRQHDYIEKSNMEVDHEYFPEEIIQAKMRSLTEGRSMPASSDYLTETTISSLRAEDGVYIDDMDPALSISGGDEDMQDLLNQINFSSDEETGFFEEWCDFEETSPEVVQKENRFGRPPESLKGYIVLDENSQSVEEDFQRTEAGDASGLTDYVKDARPGHTASLHKQSACYPRRTRAQIVPFQGSNHRSTPVTGGQQIASPGRYRDIKRMKAREPEATSRQTAATMPLPLTPRNPSNWSHISRSQELNRKMHAKEGCRAPVDYLVNIVAGILLLAVMLRWLIMHWSRFD